MPSKERNPLVNQWVPGLAVYIIGIGAVTGTYRKGFAGVTQSTSSGYELGPELPVTKADKFRESTSSGYELGPELFQKLRHRDDQSTSSGYELGPELGGYSVDVREKSTSSGYELGPEHTPRTTTRSSKSTSSGYELGPEHTLLGLRAGCAGYTRTIHRRLARRPLRFADHAACAAQGAPEARRHRGQGLRQERLKSDAERVAFLFDLYHGYTSLLPADDKPKRGRRAKTQ